MENRLGLPEWLVEAVDKTRGEYDSGKSDYSITSLLQPAMVQELKRIHNPPEDVTDQLQAFIGTSCHNQIEWALKGNPRYIVEERLYHTFHIPDAPGDKKEFIVSSQLDLYDKQEKALWDHKASKLYSFTGDGKKEHEQQLAYQCYLLKKAGYEVESVQISGFGLDWAKTQVGLKADYPKSLFCHTPYPQWADEDVEEFIKSRILDMEYAKLGQIRVCTKEERWARPDQFKVKRKGRKTALRVLYSQQEAEEYIANLPKPDGKEYIEVVEGEDIRCVHFCNVREHCNFYKEKYGG